MLYENTHHPDARSKEDRIEFLNRRVKYVVLINYGLFVGYTFDQFVNPAGSAGIVAAAVFAIFMAIRLYRIESAEKSRNSLEEVQRRPKGTV